MRAVLIFCLVFVSSLAKAQLYDAQWAMGYYESVIDFRTQDTVVIDTLPTLQYFFMTNASICDENGSLLYYTNGVSICSIDRVIQNGTGLSMGRYSASDSLDGLDIPQGAIFIPQPGNNQYYYLFHECNDTFNFSRPGTVYYSLVEKYNGGSHGYVIKKNVPLITGNMYREGGITVCKHANGRDYWLVFGASGTNGFYKFLITHDSIFGPYIQNIGPSYETRYDIAYSKFSQDGSKYVTGAYEGLILVMDFDRCTGEFSNPVTIFNNIASNPDSSLSGCAAVEISPNNRFVYASGNLNLVQYDLLNLHDSVQVYKEDSTTPFGVDFLQMAPNGKLYCSTWAGGLYALHVVNNPNDKGDSCKFVYAGQPTLTISSFNLPNLINYRLGPQIGSGCDTITAISDVNSANDLIRIQPNPANKFLYVEVGMQGNYQFNLLSANGQLIDKRETRQVDMFDTQALPAGNYFLQVLDKTTGKEVGVRKLIVAH